MNIVDRLAESMFAPSCGRCGCQMEDRLGWRRNKQFSSSDQLIAWDWLCPACVVDHDWFMAHPPENPDTDSVSSTPDLKGEPDAVRSPL